MGRLRSPPVQGEGAVLVVDGAVGIDELDAGNAGRAALRAQAYAAVGAAGLADVDCDAAAGEVDVLGADDDQLLRGRGAGHGAGEHDGQSRQDELT